jgi:hypothetical protein
MSENFPPEEIQYQKFLEFLSKQVMAPHSSQITSPNTVEDNVDVEIKNKRFKKNETVSSPPLKTNSFGPKIYNTVNNDLHTQTNKNKTLNSHISSANTDTGVDRFASIQNHQTRDVNQSLNILTESTFDFVTDTWDFFFLS